MHINRFLCLMILLLAGFIPLYGSFWDDIDFVQKSYTKTGNIKCDVNIDYYNDYALPTKDFAITGSIVIVQDKYYSKLGDIEMVISGNNSLMLDRKKRYAYFGEAKKDGKLQKNPITMNDITAMMDSSKKTIDTVYVLSENDSIRTYYIKFKAHNYYKFMHFGFNKNTGMITQVNFFMQQHEMEKVGMVAINYQSSYNLTEKDIDRVNIYKYIKKGNPIMLTAEFKNYELIMDKSK